MSDHAKQNAKGHAESIAEGIAALKALDAGAESVKFDGETYEDGDDVRRHLEEIPLSVEVRSDWHTPGEDSAPGEYSILLSTGGPALRLTGGLDYGQPGDARLEWQDWGTPWTEYTDTTEEQDAALLEFARLFCFEG
jgi:hypothetical protein